MGPNRVAVPILGFLRAIVEREGVTFMPEPSIGLLLWIGLAVLAVRRKRRLP